MKKKRPIKKPEMSGPKKRARAADSAGEATGSASAFTLRPDQASPTQSAAVEAGASGPAKLQPEASTPTGDPTSHVCNCPNCTLRRDPVGTRGAYKEHLKAIFLENFRKIGTQYGAAQTANVDFKTVSRWRESDPVFNEAFMEADAQAGGRVETSFYQRAVNGTPHYATKGGEVQRDSKGNPVVLYRDFSDAAQIFYLKSRMPDRYQEKVKQELDIRIVHTLAGEVLALIRKVVPDFCPHCKVALAITPRLAQELTAIAARLVPAKEAA